MNRALDIYVYDRLEVAVGESSTDGHRQVRFKIGDAFVRMPAERAKDLAKEIEFWVRAALPSSTEGSKDR